MSEILPYGLPGNFNLLTKAEQRSELDKANRMLDRYADKAQDIAESFMNTAGFVAATADTMAPGSVGRAREFDNAVKLMDSAGRVADSLMRAIRLRMGYAVPQMPDVLHATQNNYYEKPKPVKSFD